ncbi:MAG TPA: 6-pyruvoyl-tetrahydropterin synthase-related protein, partial [Anaerolineae bacterium]
MSAAHTRRCINTHGILVTVACVFIGLMAAQPLLYGNLPFGADTLLHLYRVVQLDELVRQGVWYSRWMPDLAFGYGYPLFNYYAPLAYYLVEVLHLLGLDFVPAFMAASALLMVLAAIFTYLFARNLTNRFGALVATAGYAFAPYLILTGLHTGSISQLAAMALLPAVFWAFHRSTLQFSFGRILLAATIYAFLMLSHNITTFIATLFLVLYVLFITLTQRRPFGALAPLAALALGIGLTTFYWLPVLTENNLVQLDRTILGTAFDFHANFVTPGELLALPSSYDPHKIGAGVPYTLSWPVLLAAIIGIAAWFRHLPSTRSITATVQSRAETWQAGFALVVVVISVLLTTPLSQALWESVPMMRFVQFPTRFLSITSLFVALFAGIGIGRWFIQTDSWERFENRQVMKFALMTALIAGAFAVYAFFWQYIARYAPMHQPSIAEFSKYERDNGWIGTTSMGEYLPLTVQVVPTQTVVGQSRFERASLPIGAQLIAAGSGALSHYASVNSTQPWTAIFNVFAFAGWYAQIDGQPVSSAPTTPSGLVSVAVPAGKHQISIDFHETPERNTSDLISMASLTLAAIGLIIAIILGKRTTQNDERDFAEPFWVSLPLMGIVLVLFAFKGALIDTSNTIFYRTRFNGAAISGVRQALSINFSQQIDLIGADAPLSSDTSHPAPLTLYWRAKATRQENLSVGVEVVDSGGFVVGHSDHQHPAGFPVIRWYPDGYAEDAYSIPLDAGTPPGIYSFRVTIYRYGHPEARVAAFDRNGALSGTTFDSIAVSVITTTLRRTARTEATPDLLPQHVLHADTGASASLLGFDLPSTTTAAGERMPVSLYWHVNTVSTEDWQVSWTLTKTDDTWSTVIKTDAIEGYPASQWIAGDEWKAPHSVRIPPAIPSGHYRLSVGVTGHAPVFLTEIDVAGSDHVFMAPPVAHAQVARFSDTVDLVGYNYPETSRPGDVITLTLVWHVYAETETRYKTFVHLVDMNDNRVAGVDSVPV